MQTSKLIKILNYLVAIILVLVPFQALLTTWAGSNFGHIDLFRIWKELLLVPVAIGSLYLVLTDKKLKKWFTNSPLVILILAFVMLQLALGWYALTTNKVNNSALIYALLINIRYLIFFLVCLILATKSDWLPKNWPKLILWPAAIVVVFGLLQHFLLPDNFLAHFGYGPKTIPAFQAVDLKPQYIRLQSTLRGPNPLGAYLVVVITCAIALVITKQKQRRQRAILILGSIIALFFTYSRSAWLGTIVGLALLTYWLVKNQKNRQIMLIATVALVVIGLVGALTFRQNSVVENTFFHTSRTSRSAESSNAVRTEAMLEGVKTIWREPLGAGPGTAGPASARNTYHTARIAENYFIQVGQEVGVIGLAIFIAINLYIAKLLWDKRQNDLALIVLAALVGLTLVNCVSHAWTDDTLAYIFWGLAGIALAPSVILGKGTKPKHGQTKKAAA